MSKSLPIRQTLNALPGLNRTAKAVLIEVCELAENGGKGGCNAKNEYLVGRLGGTERTVSRALTLLESCGLLISQGQGKARVLVATDALRACYAGATEADRRVAAFALNLASTARPNLDKSGNQPRQSVYVEEPANLDKSGNQPRQNGSTNLDKSGQQPRQNGSRVYRDDQNDQLNDHNEQVKSLRAALAEAQKKIEQQAEEIASLKKECETWAAEHYAARPLPEAPNASASHTKGGALIFPDWATDAFRQHWAEWVTYRNGKRDKLKPASLQKLLDKLADFDEAYCLHLFDNAISNGYTGLVFPDTKLKFAQHLQAQQGASSHGTHPSQNQSAQRGAYPRQSNGAKPTADAGAFARAFAEQAWE